MWSLGDPVIWYLHTRTFDTASLWQKRVQKQGLHSVLLLRHQEDSFVFLDCHSLHAASSGHPAMVSDYHSPRIEHGQDVCLGVVQIP
jgi:hypothetical protein